jgi:hypothetical protein
MWLAHPRTSGSAASRLVVTDMYFDSHNFSSQFHISNSIHEYAFFAQGA